MSWLWSIRWFLYSTSGYRRSVTVVFIPKPSNFTVLAEHFRLTALLSLDHKLANFAVDRQLCSSKNPADDTFQFAYRSSRFTMDYITPPTPLVHRIYKPLDTWMESARYAFLDHSFAFGSVSCGLLPEKSEGLCCLMAWLPDCFTNHIQCKRVWEGVKHHIRWLTARAFIRVMFFHHILSLCTAMAG